MKYKPSKEVKNSMAIVMPFILMNYLYFIVYIITFNILNLNKYSGILVEIFSFLSPLILRPTILFLILPIYFFYKITTTEKILGLKKQIIFILRNNFVFLFTFITIDYLVSLLKQLTLEILDISLFYGVSFCGTYVKTELINYFYLLLYSLVLFLFYNLYMLISTVLLLKLSNFIKLKMIT